MADKIFFKTGSASSLPTTKTAGQLLFAIDGTTGSIYLDKDSNTRIKFNADAAKLATARTINGTLFDGSDNITTDNWGTARTITIGNTGKSVNGSQAYSWSLNEIGALPGKTTSATTAATAGWYRIATTSVNINNHLGQFTIQADPSGKHCLAIINAGISYGYTDGINLQQMSYVKYSSSPILTKARIVYHTTYSNNYAYLEVYVSSATATTIKVQFNGFGWTLVEPSTAGSVPSGYSTKEITFVSNSIVSNLSGKATSAGIADSASKLSSAKTINGTSFDGSDNITTDKWGAARDFTIGNTKKPVNGSAGVSWSLSEIGAVQQVSYNSNTVDVNTLYDTGVYNITSSALVNGPSSYAFGQIFTMAYRKPTGNTTPDHAGQIYIHGGDTVHTLSNVLCFRTSNSSTWSPWQMAAHGTAGTAVGSSTVPVYMSSNGTITACGSSLGVNITGSAAKLTTARNIALAGDVTGSTSFDGSGNVSIITAVSDDSHNHSYSTINLKGNYVSNTDYTTLPDGITYIEMPATPTVTTDPIYGAMLTVKYGGNRAFQMVGNSNNKLYFRAMHSGLSSDAGTGYGTWRLVALSDGGTYTMNITGNASGTASKLATARNITISGTASSSVGTFDGSANTTIYMPLTIDGFNEIKTKKLTITGTEQVSHIAFSRGAWNYFTAPTSGGFAFVPNGGTTTHGAGATFVIAGTTVFPGEKDNTIDLGTSTYKWKNVYATTFTGALSGNATTATTLATTRALRISDTANSTSTASFNGSADATLYIPTTIKGFTSIESDKFVVNDKVTLQYNTTNECLEFVFA